MNYYVNPKNGDKISILGLGCMRFTRKGPSIDQEKCERELALALERGINYFDTAYIYPGIEAAVGKFIEKSGMRSRMLVSAKLPHYLARKAGDFDRYFDEELRRLRTDYIDYYLIHTLNDITSWERLVNIGMPEWILRQKENGRIRNIGFSFHGGTTEFKALLNVYPWEFTMVQFNYLDESSQAGIEGIRSAHSRGLPVFIMEPLRGGRLSGLTPEALQVLKKSGLSCSPAELSLRWIWDHPEIAMILSGMNSVEQIEENVLAADRAYPGCMSEKEHETVKEIRDTLIRETKVGCTGCSYCMPCPAGVDIPVCFSCYNDRFSHGWYLGMKEYFMCTTLRKNPSNASKCISCGKCEEHCPQKIEIRKELKNVAARMEGPAYRIARRALKLIGRNY